MFQNAEGGANKKKWSCSHGLRQPIYTMPVPVDELKIRPQKGADIREKKELYDPETGKCVSAVRHVGEALPVKRRRVWESGLSTFRR